jgi:uncharacterized protein
MIIRTADKEIRVLASRYKSLAVVGPRQSGKTTLAKHIFGSKPYVSLENPDARQFAESDPRGFLEQFPNGAVLDEIQRVPQLFSYLQQIIDESSETGLFILSGSNNFLLQENISQSLAGRIAYLFLLPFSIEELANEGLLPSDAYHAMFAGGYPPIYDLKIPPSTWYLNYIRTYVERDVRQIKNITNLGAFERFLRLCAGRVGQLLNMNSLGIEAGVDHKTVASWLGVLESSFIVHLLRPHHQNFNKRVVKMPKLYFYDTGLACALLGIQNEAQLITHPLRGSLFENFIISEMVKARFNKNEPNNLYFWRDSTGNEIDVIIDKAGKLFPVEIKSGKTVTDDYFKGLNFWSKITGAAEGVVVYAGDAQQKRSNGMEIRPWNQVGEL